VQTRNEMLDIHGSLYLFIYLFIFRSHWVDRVSYESPKTVKACVEVAFAPKVNDKERSVMTSDYFIHD
jgi:hypothetical protein